MLENNETHLMTSVDNIEVNEHPAIEATVPKEVAQATTQTPDVTNLENHTPDQEGTSSQPTAEQLQAESVLREALQSTIQESFEVFSDQIEKMSLLEMALVMEELSRIELNKQNIRKVGVLKRRFDNISNASLKDINSKADDDKEKSIQYEAYKNASRRFTSALGKFNKRKLEFEEQDFKERSQNSAKKKALLEQLKEIVSKEDPTQIEPVRKIYEEWKKIGPVLQQDNEEFFQMFRALLDKFYAMREQYNELVDQDRKYNLQEKQKLTLELISYIPTDDQVIDNNYWIETGERVKAIQERWKEIGPVPRAVADDLWNRFKQASDEYYEKRRNFFGELDKIRSENAARRQQIISELEPFANFESENSEEWRKANETVRNLIEEWRKTGPAPTVINKDLVERFKQIVESFRSRRTELQKLLESNRAEFLARKEMLAKQAEELKDSNDMVRTAETLKQLQREWQNTGDDEYKEARKLKKRFRKACDFFFERHKHYIADSLNTEEKNYKRKTEICEILEAMPRGPEHIEFVQQAQQLREEYDSLGRVPYKYKDKIIARFQKAFNDFINQTVTDRFERDRLTMQSRFAGMRSQPNSVAQSKAVAEETKIKSRIRKIEDEILQYENNILFISGKGADAIRKDIELKINSAKELKSRLEQQLKVVVEARKASQANPNTVSNKSDSKVENDLSPQKVEEKLAN